MCEYKRKIQKIIFIALEIIFNVVNLVIIPKANTFEKRNLYHECNEYFYLYDYSSWDCDVDDLAEDLNSTKKTTIAIIVFAGFMCLLHLIKLIRSFCLRYDEYEIIDKVVIVINICSIIINFSLSISLDVTLKDVHHNSTFENFFNELASSILGVTILYGFCLISNFFQCCPCCCCWCDDDGCCREKTVTVSTPRIINYNYNYNYTPSINNNNNNNISSTSRNIIATRVQVRQTITRTTTTRVLLLSNVLPRQIYENLRSFIELGKQKLIALVKFYQEMQFVGFTSGDDIINEITSIVVMVSVLLSEVFEDPVTKVLLQSKTEENIMLLMHYTFPLIIEVIKLKIEKGVYRRNNVIRVNLVQVLTQVERNIIRDEQGNIRLSFRVSRQVNQSSLAELLNQ